MASLGSVGFAGGSSPDRLLARRSSSESSEDGYDDSPVQPTSNLVLVEPQISPRGSRIPSMRLDSDSDSDGIPPPPPVPSAEMRSKLLLSHLAEKKIEIKNSGWLRLQQGGAWSRGFAILESNRMKIFAGESDLTPSLIIWLDDYRLHPSSADAPMSFAIQGRRTVFKFAVATETEQQSWTAALSTCVRSASPTSDPIRARTPTITTARSADRKSGWICKRKSKLKNWKARWFVLNEESLSYFKDDSNTQSAIGVLYLKGAKMKEVEVTGGKAGFQIKFDKRAGGGEKTKHSHSKYHLSFASEEEAKQWRAAIVEVVYK